MIFKKNFCFGRHLEETVHLRQMRKHSCSRMEIKMMGIHSNCFVSKCTSVFFLLFWSIDFRYIFQYVSDHQGVVHPQHRCPIPRDEHVVGTKWWGLGENDVIFLSKCDNLSINFFVFTYNFCTFWHFFAMSHCPGTHFDPSDRFWSEITIILISHFRPAVGRPHPVGHHLRLGLGAERQLSTSFAVRFYGNFTHFHRIEISPYCMHYNMH